MTGTSVDDAVAEATLVFATIVVYTTLGSRIVVGTETNDAEAIELGGIGGVSKGGEGFNGCRGRSVPVTGAESVGVWSGGGSALGRGREAPGGSMVSDMAVT